MDKFIRIYLTTAVLSLLGCAVSEWFIVLLAVSLVTFLITMIWSTD